MSDTESDQKGRSALLPSLLRALVTSLLSWFVQKKPGGPAAPPAAPPVAPVAAADPAFVPHAWAGRAEPDEGRL